MTSTPGSGDADARRVVAVEAVHAHDGRGFGQPVALADRQAQPDEGLRDVRVQRRAAADAQPQAPAEALEQLLRHQGFQQRPREERQPPRPATLAPLEAVPAHLPRVSSKSLRFLRETPTSVALICAWSFSKMRGTDTMIVGRTLFRSSPSCAMERANATVEPDSIVR